MAKMDIKKVSITTGLFSAVMGLLWVVIVGLTKVNLFEAWITVHFFKVATEQIPLSLNLIVASLIAHLLLGALVGALFSWLWNWTNAK